MDEAELHIQLIISVGVAPIQHCKARVSRRLARVADLEASARFVRRAGGFNIIRSASGADRIRSLGYRARSVDVRGHIGCRAPIPQVGHGPSRWPSSRKKIAQDGADQEGPSASGVLANRLRGCLLCGTVGEGNSHRIACIDFCVGAARSSSGERRCRFWSSADACAAANCTVLVRDGFVPSDAAQCVGGEAWVTNPAFAMEHRPSVMACDARVLREGFALAGPLTRLCRSYSGRGILFPGCPDAGPGRRLRHCDPRGGIALGMEKSAT